MKHREKIKLEIYHYSNAILVNPSKQSVCTHKSITKFTADDFFSSNIFALKIR